MAFAKFDENRFRIDGEIAENHAILVNLTASICVISIVCKRVLLKLHNCFVYFNQKINPLRMVFYFFYFTAPVTELLRI